MSKCRNISAGLTAAVISACVLLSSAAGPSSGSADDGFGSGNIYEYEVLSNRHTQYVEAGRAVSYLTTEGYEEKLSGSAISLFYSSEEETIRVLDKRTGYIWGCVDENSESGLNKKWKSRANSVCYITYFDRKNSLVGEGLSENNFTSDYKWGKDSAKCSVSSRRLGISFDFTLAVEEDSLIFSVDDASIEETGACRLAEISFVNFFGSVYEDSVPGYVLVPDGSGALIRFGKAGKYSSGYERDVYGNDPAIEPAVSLNNLNGNRTDDFATEEHTMTFPVWGVVHGEGQNAFLATVDGGAEYSRISAIPAGAETATVKYTRAYATFIYRRLYDKRVSNSKTVSLPQENLNDVGAEITYKFLESEDADYSGMARKYREKLISEKLLPTNVAGCAEASVFLNIMGSEVKEGLLSNSIVRLTDAAEAKEILKDLSASGVTSYNAVFSGWTSGGYSGFGYNDFSFERKVGGENGISGLKEYIEDSGNKFSLTLRPVYVNEDQVNINRETALNATTDIIKQSVPNNTLMYPDKYLIRHSLLTECLEALNKKLSGYDIFCEDIAEICYSDYTVGEETSRKEAMENITAAMSGIKSGIMLDSTNLYLLRFASGIVNIPVSCSQYVYETDSVPFVQMVLRGSVDYYAPYSNQGFYSDASVLKMIEYGAWPSFMLMAADNFELYNTPLENYFSLNYDNWKERIIYAFDKVGGALAATDGTALVSHTVVSEGVYRTEYENGCVIWVNYMNSDFSGPDGIVGANNYLVKENKP